MLHNIARLSRQTNLPDRNIRPELKPARIDQRKHAPIPIGIAIDAVARSPRQIFNNGNLFAYHSIKKCGLANIRSAHNSYKRLHNSPSTLSAHKAAPTKGALCKEYVIGAYYNIRCARLIEPSVILPIRAFGLYTLR